MAESNNALTKLHDLLLYMLAQLNKFPQDQYGGQNKVSSLLGPFWW
jgi:hypothetical protein